MRLVDQQIGEQPGNRLQDKNGDHRRDVDVSNGRNNLAEGRDDRLNDAIEGFERLVVPTNVGKPAAKAPNYDKQVDELHKPANDLHNVDHDITWLLNLSLY